MIELRGIDDRAKVLELGGGDNPHPRTNVNVDVRPGPKVHFPASFDEPLKDKIKDDDFDVVFSQYALEHVSYRNIPRFLKDVFRITKHGGEVVFVTSNTRAQIDWLLAHPDGWDGRSFFDSASGLLYGDQDYPENSHKCYFDPGILAKLFAEAGFSFVTTTPYGERNTDIVVHAKVNKTSSVLKSEEPSETHQNVLDSVFAQSQQQSVVNDDSAQGKGGSTKFTGTFRRVETPSVTEQKLLPEFLTTEGRASLFDKDYFNGGKKVGGYAREGLWDFPCHYHTAKHILERKPTSVLELGCGRGYVLKRLEDAGIPVLGLEISKHCYLTRAVENILNCDLCVTPWVSPPPHDFDLCYSVATLEHIPERYLPAVIEEMVKTSKRGLHGVDFGHHDDGFDKTHVTLRPRDWWVDLFAKHAPGYPVEIVDKEELEKGEFPREYLEGDGRLKLNLGSFCVMYHNGWFNIDMVDATPPGGKLSDWAKHYGYKFLCHDLRVGLPFGTGVVDCISISHALEHFTYPDALKLLRECRRVIRPDGALRIAVPDVERLTSMYKDKCLGELDELNDEASQSPTQAGKLWALLHTEHWAQYDAETLCYYLREAGWKSRRSQFRASMFSNWNLDLILQETLDVLPALSLYCDAVPELG